MPIETVVIAIACTAVAAFGMAYTLIKIFDHLRRKDAEREAAEIIAKSKQEAENRRREGELQLKELMLKQQEESEKELRKIRGELHERERLLDKRQDALEEQVEQVRKQEKIVEGTQASSRRRSRRRTIARTSFPSCWTCSGRRFRAQRTESGRGHAAASGSPRHPAPAGDRRGDPPLRQAIGRNLRAKGP